MMVEAFIYDAIRTPRGRGNQKGALAGVKPISLVTGLLTEMLHRHKGLDPNRIDDVILGVGSPLRDQGAVLARIAALAAGLPNTVGGVQLSRFCASGLEAVNTAAQKVASGWEELFIAGGVESLSHVAMGADGGAWALDPETSWELQFVPQGVGADLIATLDGITREDVDAYALTSQRRSEDAWKQGYFDNSVIPVRDRNGLVVLDRDEYMRPETSAEGLAALKPAFVAAGAAGFDDVALQKYHQVERINHVHTAGNSSGIVDGAGIVLVGSAAVGAELGLRPRARIVATAIIGDDPTIMLTAPAGAARKALARAGLTATDIDLFELNEAFASVVLRFVAELDISLDQINVNGGAIAMGHPIGATGAMILGTLLDELERRELRYGLASLCAGGGLGIATIIERV
ncbi:acetyl-CoA C-acetyltransferase [Jatrophihabitans sp.]|uniref:acetyl-CoA C-acetyltransferase n=1 Tax=Jatrophihabitans sp. TaxID=1932789 RepID=UPI0030C6DEE6